ncbi:STAS domain-containing protein [Pseudonocardia benzenivorans]|uniref:Sulfate transporter/antisigma-factor antagonist STAS n=2 Tax=Pseudonocardia TaxID=1847 RepID=F4CZZ8_PSEUX|nr:STAS domain-containing protein [Pseudonocardia dioxanivorans]AEA24831.1 Sulfate transporter/antisigma-factor antagonist STAS [Pseudonocardia dioxanivorans CB1190]GJF02724.1 hypothetical protein PSD17_16860 [Pseudonocardia sp. D17]
MPPVSPAPLADGDGLHWIDVPDHGARSGALFRAEVSASVQGLRLVGDVDAPEASALVSTATEVLDAGADVVVDLRGVTFLGSRGISALIRVHQLAVARGRHVRVVVDRSDHVVMRPLTLTEVDATLDLVSSLDGAPEGVAEDTDG